MIGVLVRYALAQYYASPFYAANPLGPRASSTLQRSSRPADSP